MWGRRESRRELHLAAGGYAKEALQRQTPPSEGSSFLWTGAFEALGLWKQRAGIVRNVNGSGGGHRPPEM